MDFTLDMLAGGPSASRTSSTNSTRECVAIGSTSRSGRAGRACARPAGGRPRPAVGDRARRRTRFVGLALDTLKYAHGVALRLIRLVKSIQKRLRRELQRALSNECPNEHWCRCVPRHRGLAHRLQHRAVASLAAATDACGLCRLREPCPRVEGVLGGVEERDRQHAQPDWADCRLADPGGRVT